MPINLDVAVLAGSTGEGTKRLDVLEGPPLAVYHVVAVGVLDIAAGGGRVVQLANRPGADAVLVRFQLDAVSTQASAGDAGTFRLESGQIINLGIDEQADSDDMELDIRAAVQAVDVDAEYETVAASQTAQILGAAGAAGDFLKRIVIVPATTSPGVVTVLDGATPIISFAGGASSVADLAPIVVQIEARAVTNWNITTGANVSVQAIGDFT